MVRVSLDELVARIRARIYSTYARGLDMMNTAYHYLDLAPRGRDEEGRSPQFWVRRHDEYGG